MEGKYCMGKGMHYCSTNFHSTFWWGRLGHSLVHKITMCCDWYVSNLNSMMSELEVIRFWVTQFNHVQFPLESATLGHKMFLVCDNKIW